jgi:hypothetical protein
MLIVSSREPIHYNRDSFVGSADPRSKLRG